MPFGSTSSRRRFRDYRKEFTRRKQSGEFNVGGSFHSPDRPVHKRTRSFGVLLREFFRLLKGQRRAMAIALSTLTVATLLALVPPAATKIVIDYVFTDRPLPDSWPTWAKFDGDRHQLLIGLAISVVAISVVKTLIHIWGRWHATRATKMLQSSIRTRVFEHAVRLPLHRIYQLKSGGVASILREDGGGVADLIFNLLYNPWRAIIMLLGSMAVLAWTDWRLLVGSLVLIPSVWFSHRTWINRIRPIYRDIRQQRQEIDSHATEAFGGMRVVRAFGRQRSEGGRFTRGNHLMSRQELLVWVWSRFVEIAWALLIPAASAALLWYGGSRVLEGSLTPGDLIMFLFYLGMLLSPLEELANSATQFQTNLAGLDRILDLLGESQEMPSKPGEIVLDRRSVRGGITFDNVSFAYPAAKSRVLENVTFTARPGQMVALVGHSGAGKTTLCNLVARFYDPTEGRVLLDGVDLRDIEVDSYRSLLGVVEQDIFLFDGSIAANIGYADRNATREQVEEAARIANAHEFITSFEKGYSTLIGERGVRLSGGQRQRLAIARAVLADPRILILDEATSNLDTESERLIQTSLSLLMRGRTSFVIAHRLSTIMHADLILVMDHGRVAEHGTHDELMARSGRYRHMVLLQTTSHEESVARLTESNGVVG
jgi:ATP-binding cassette, subfamily B, bacterial